MPTYFTLGKYALPESVQEKIVMSGGEVIDNLVFLGESSFPTQGDPPLDTALTSIPWHDREIRCSHDCPRAEDCLCRWDF